MLEKVTPEQVGISSKSVKKYIKILEKNEFSTHSIVMLRHGKVFYEAYWEPFHKDFLHRIYSSTKSFVALAIGFLQQDGLIDLDAPAVSYLDDDITKNACDEVKKQTIRDMLIMSTAGMCTVAGFFKEKPEDRLRYYYDCAGPDSSVKPKLTGSTFLYDSSGSFVLGCIVEIITGMGLMDYLREKLFDKIGFSKEAYCLTCPGGHAWSDSGILCRPMDLAKVMQFLLNEGEWNGEQILDKKFIKEATSNLVSTKRAAHRDSGGTYGYGYLIWRTAGNGFAFMGLGNQLAIAFPDYDMVFVVTADNQTNPKTGEAVMIDRLLEEIAETAKNEALDEDKEAYSDLMDFTNSLKLYSFSGSIEENISKEISGKTFIMEENPMGISKIKFTFTDDVCKMDYTNAQSDKTIEFGINKNVFGIFPQEGYSDLVGNTYAPGNYYKCAASAAWTHERNLEILVQVIDKYFGKLFIKVFFTEDGRIAVSMNKTAENFMNEYMGYAQSIAE